MIHDTTANQRKGAASNTADVLKHHRSSIRNRDLAALMADYDAEARLFTQNGILRGPAAIREFFATFLEEFAKPGASMKGIREDVEGDTAYIVWTADTADNRYEFATDTFVVRKGKIVTQTFAAKIAPKPLAG